MSGRRHAHQYGESFGMPEERIKPNVACGEKTSLGRRKKPGPAPIAHSGKAPDLSGPTLEPFDASFLRRKVASVAATVPSAHSTAGYLEAQPLGLPLCSLL